MSIKWTSMDSRHFDLVVGVFVSLLVITIGVVIARGDQVGIKVQSFGPSDLASGKPPIQVGFDEPVDLASLNTHFSIEPPLQGQLGVAGTQMVFRPNELLKPGQSYTITLHAGLAATSGRQLKQDQSWQIHVRSPRVAYLAPLSGETENLYIVDPNRPDAAQELSDGKDSVTDYAVAPDGSKIVYAELTQAGTNPLMIWDAGSQTTSQLFDCNDAVCQNPVWRPDGGAIAFEHVDFNTALGGTPGLPRVWVFDFATNSAHAVLSDSQIVTSLPHWSPDSTQLAMQSDTEESIIIHNFTTGKDRDIPIDPEEFGPNGFGDFSPDGRYLFVQKIVVSDSGTGFTHLSLLDLSTDPPTRRDVEDKNEAMNDMDAVWQPDSKAFLVTRLPSVTQDSLSTPIYRLDIATDKATVILPADNYNQDNLHLSPAGTALVFERTITSGESPETGIWTFDLITGDLKQIAQNATNESWLP